MATRVGINGFGRIGRQSVRAALERYPQDLEIVAVNDITEGKTNAHLFRYDSTYGRFPGTVEVEGSDLVINGRRITVFAQPDPGRIPWEEVGAQMVIESTGRFTAAEQAWAHLHGGVKKVIISAPLHSTATVRDTTIVLGVNEQTYDPARHQVISNASCTTNCLAPTAKGIHDTFGIEQGLMTTVHAYTNDQRLLSSTRICAAHVLPRRISSPPPQAPPARFLTSRAGSMVSRCVCPPPPSRWWILSPRCAVQRAGAPSMTPSNTRQSGA